jgi:hypothetical protein
VGYRLADVFYCKGLGVALVALCFWGGSILFGLEKFDPITPMVFCLPAIIGWFIRFIGTRKTGF